MHICTTGIGYFIEFILIKLKVKYKQICTSLLHILLSLHFIHATHKSIFIDVRACSCVMQFSLNR